MLYNPEIKSRILAVDDDEIILLQVEQILGYAAEIVGLDDGTEALDYLASHSVDMVLLDYQLPGMNGLEVLSAMKSRAELKNVPVIVLTGDDDINLEAEVFRLGAVDFVKKPFVFAALQERVMRTLQTEYLKRQLREEVSRQLTMYQSQVKHNRQLFEESVLALSQAIDAKDVYTQGHSLRVANYSQNIMRLAGGNETAQREIYHMGILHDIGKISVPGHIINKRGRLTEEEYGIIKSHTVIGAEILRTIVDFPKLSVAARHHHERYDGGGYPDGLKGAAIPKEARIIAVADAYDAMTSKRSYRDVMAQERVRHEIERGKGSQFDPLYADIMLTIIDEDTDYRLHG